MKNYGIIGNVNAQAVALGDGAQAVVHRTDGGGAGPSIEMLERAIRAAEIPAEKLEALEAEVARLKQLAPAGPEKKTEATSVLESLVGKLKLAGVALEATAALHEPLKQLAAWFGVPLHF